MFTRYASFESAEVLDVRSAPTRQRTASLDKLSEFDKYRTDDGYVYVRIRAISSRTNKNHDGWPSVELAGSPEIFKRHQAGTGFTVEASDGNPKYGFATFLHKPIFVDHHNTDPEKGRGVIRDTKLRVLDQHTASTDDYWKSSNVDPEHLPATEVELLLEVDAHNYPKFAKAIVNGDLDGFSMGANVGKTKCSHCGNIATDPTEFCSHVLMKGANHDYTTASGEKISKKSYENCYDVQFFEISGVFDPADPTALSREVRSGVEKEGWVTGPGGQEYADPMRPNERELGQEAKQLSEQYGMDLAQAFDLVQRRDQVRRGKPDIHGEGFNVEDYPKMWDYDRVPENLTLRYPDPDDERFPSDFPNDPRWSKTAEHDLPQEFLVRAPDEVDTLRDEQICPICGSKMTGTTCDVCQYTKPPESFDNPDLNKATEIRDQMKQQDDPTNPQNAMQGPPMAPTQPTKSPSTAAVTNDMHWTPILHPKTAALINNSEQPVSTSNRPLSNDTRKETVVSDQTKPVTSAMLTAKQLIEKARNNQMNTRTADGATPLPEASPKQRVDVTGVGSVDQGSNEEASKAKNQVDVTGIGGAGVTDVSADKTESLPEAGRDSDDAGFDKTKNQEQAPHTKTYDRYDGTQDGARDPITNESLEEQEQQGGSKGPVSGKPSYSHQVRAYDDKTLEQNEQQGDEPIAQGERAVEGVKPVDPVATDSYRRVNVLEHQTSPENNSGPTKTWTGTDGNGVLKQQPPVTNQLADFPGNHATDGYPGPPSGGPTSPLEDIGAKSSGTIRIKALQVLDAEEELGMLTREAKWQRAAELENMSDAELGATLATYSRVTARVSKLASTRQSSVTKVPRMFGKQTSAPDGFERIASDQPKEEAPVSDDSLDAAVFLR